MNILLIFPGFIIAFVIVLYYEYKIRNLRSKLKNKVHFYAARDKDGILWLYIGKPIRKTCTFFSCDCGKILISSEEFSKYGLNIHDFDYLKWEDEPVEVFLNLEN